MLKISLLLTLLVVVSFGFQKDTDKAEKNLLRDNSKEVVKDSAAGLMFQDDSGAKSVKKNWEDAKKYCQDLILGGHDDWSLPTISELESIRDYDKYEPAVKKGFENISPGDYWTLSPNTSRSEHVWIVHFEYGVSKLGNKGVKRNIRCVRVINK